MDRKNGKGVEKMKLIPFLTEAEIEKLKQQESESDDSIKKSQILALSLRKEVFSLLKLITLLVVIRVVLPLAYELGKAYGMKWIEKRFDDDEK